MDMTSKVWLPASIGAATLALLAGGATAQGAQQAGFRSDTVEIPLASADQPGGMNELEYKVRMKKGGTFKYAWSVSGLTNPEEFYYDFHGHTLEARDKMTVQTYKQATGLSASGDFTAPFEGVHGWYLQNQGVPPVVVKLTISGVYELIPPGETGNEAGVIANKPAAEALQTPPRKP